MEKEASFVTEEIRCKVQLDSCNIKKGLAMFINEFSQHEECKKRCGNVQQGITQNIVHGTLGHSYCIHCNCIVTLV